MDKLRELKKAEGIEADKLSATAQNLAAASLSATTMAAAQFVIASIQESERTGTVKQSSQALRRIRTDPKLMAALDRDMRIALKQAELLIVGALTVGYSTEAEGQAEALKIDISVTVTPEDIAAFSKYPVLGHTASEAAQALVDKLLYEVNGALALPLTGIIDAKTIAPSLGAVAQAHGNRVGSAVKEAYFAGVKAGFMAIGEAMTGVSQ